MFIVTGYMALSVSRRPYQTYIREGGDLAKDDASLKKEAHQPLTAKEWKLVFHHKLVGVYIGQFAVTSTLCFCNVCRSPVF